MKFLTIPFLITSVALAASRPTIPKMEEQIDLTGKKSAVEFFAARAADENCKTKVAEWETKSADALKDLEVAKAKGSVSETESAEAVWRNTRRQELEVGETCGPCVTAPVVKVSIPKPARNEVWYVAEGACQYTGKNPAVESAFANVAKSLLKVNGYGRTTGGFDPMLEFMPIDPTKGELKESKEIVPAPFHAILGMKAVEAFGNLIGYRQLVEVAATEKDNAGKKEIQITFKGGAVPATVKLPSLVEKNALGKNKNVKLFPLSELQASWYVTSSGYVHYYMAGEFGATLPFALEAGREAAREVLNTLHKRFN